MNSNRVQRHSLKNPAWSSLVLTLLAIIQITRPLFVVRTKSVLVILAVYVDDILLTRSDFATLVKTKEYLKRYFVTKDIEKLKYFLGIEVVYKNMSYFCLKENMHLISLRKQVFWDANLLALQWKPILLYDVMVSHLLMTLNSIRS